MDLGQDSPGLCRHCHQSFCSRTMLADEPVLTLLSSCMHLVSSARFSYFLRRIERRERLCHLSRRFPRTISRVRLPTAPASVHISPGRFSSLPIPVEHLSRRDATVNAVPRFLRYACIFGQAVKQTFIVNNHSNWQVFILPSVG